MRLILCAAGNPLLQKVLLFRGENLVGLRWRHDVIGISRRDAADESAFLRFAGNDGGLAVFAGKDGVVKAIEPQIGFAGGGISAVARETVFGKDRPNVAI